jgi:hypothetical protein
MEPRPLRAHAFIPPPLTGKALEMAPANLEQADLAVAIAMRAARAATTRRLGFISAAAVLLACFALPETANADKIAHPTAVFEGLDKITGRIISFEVVIDETVQFGALQITPRVCYSRPPTEAPQTDVFAEVDEIDEKKALKRIFTGWMFADSPGLHAIEHPIFDIWLTACKGGTTIIHEAPDYQASAPGADENPPSDLIDPNTAPQIPAAPPKKRRPRPQPTVVAAPENGGPLDLGTAPAGPTSGNARGR